MADAKISDLTAAGALTGAESVEVVQSGVNVKTTTGGIAALGGGGGHVIEDEGTPLTQRANMNFVGAGVTATDAGGKTVVTIPDGGAGKQDTLVSGTNIKTVNGTSVLGSGDIDLIDDAIVNGEAKAPSQNAVFDALALKLDSLVTLRTLTANHVLDSTDLASVNAGDQLVIQMNVGSANDMEIPLNASQAFPTGTVIGVRNIGAGVTTITGTGGVTLQSPLSAFDLANTYDMAYIEKVATDTWRVNGQLTA